MNGCQVSFEDVCAIEALLGSTSAAGTEAADHGTFVVGQSVPILVVLSREAFCVVFACWNGTLFWALVLMSKHVCLEVLEVPAAGCDRAETLVGIV